ncbi:MAG: hypothetical protein PF488_03050 [Patescibacteria group bacterium]|jgi:hypothetical protein|nr:hypothetical protein [Patescibacteria group bacterium]
MGKKKTNAKIRKKIATKLKDKKTLNNISSLFILVFLLIISLITFPTNSLNNYKYDNSIQNPTVEDEDDRRIGFFNLDRKPSSIKTENRDIEELVREGVDVDTNYGSEIRDNDDSYIYLGSFGYTGSNFDKEKSNLRLDTVSTGISFFPDVAVNEITENNLSKKASNFFSSLSCNNFIGDREDENCLGVNCLSLRGNNLYYNNQQINLPLEKDKIEAISISSLDSSWVLGITIKEKSEYQAYIYLYNGRSFSRIKEIPEIVSSDFGLISVGGTREDYIVVYGSTQGIAYRIRNGEAKDISSFFDYRVMKKGLKTEIIRVDDGKRVDWYVYSLSCDKPLFIKLYENDSRDIVGEISLLEEVPFIGENLYLYLEEYTDTFRKFNIHYSGIRGEKYFNFYDYGFKNEDDGYLYSKSLRFSNSEVVNLKQILRAGVTTNTDDDYSFEISPDSNTWKDMIPKENGDYILDNVSNYILRLSIDKEEDKFYSPFFTGIFFDYGYSKL